MRKGFGGLAYSLLFFVTAAAFLCTALSLSAAQKTKKSKNTDSSSQPMPSMPLSDADQIDHDIGEMLAAFELGDTEMMHKYYSDNATFVRGTFDPLLVGWQNYAALYNQSRAAFQGMQVIRRNTAIFTHGDVAWASYQWEFISMANGQPFSDRGQTTLIFNKIGGNWLIVHNHTSEVIPSPAAAPQPAGQQPAPPQTPAQRP